VLANVGIKIGIVREGSLVRVLVFLPTIWMISKQVTELANDSK